MDGCDIVLGAKSLFEVISTLKTIAGILAGGLGAIVLVLYLQFIFRVNR